MIVVFSFLLVDVFDNAGTLIGVAHAARLLDAQGNLPRMREALMADSFAAMWAPSSEPRRRRALSRALRVLLPAGGQG